MKLLFRTLMLITVYFAFGTAQPALTAEKPMAATMDSKSLIIHINHRRFETLGLGRFHERITQNNHPVANAPAAGRWPVQTNLTGSALARDRIGFNARAIED